jgi:hypothetical protein
MSKENKMRTIIQDTQGNHNANFLQFSSALNQFTNYQGKQGFESTNSQVSSNQALIQLMRGTSYNLVTNNPFVLDELFAQNAMVKKAVDLLVEATYKHPPLIQTDLLSADELQDLQNKFNTVYFEEFKVAKQQCLLYGGSYIVINFYDPTKQNESSVNFSKNVDSIKKGDIFEITAHSPWQIVNRKFLNLNGVALRNKLNKEQQKQLLDTLFGSETKINQTEENTNEPNVEKIVPYTNNYMFTGLAGAGMVNKPIDDSLILPITNGNFVPDNISTQLINRGMGLSVFESVDDDLMKYEKALKTVLDLLQAPLVRHLAVDNLQQLFTQGVGNELLKQTIEAFNNMCNQEGIMITDKESSYTQTQTTFAGIIDIINFLKNAFVEKLGIPLNIWNGEGSSGLNATGEDVDKQWSERIITEQNKSKVCVAQIVKYLAKAQYGIDLTDIAIEYNNNYTESDKVKQDKKDGLIKNLIDVQTVLHGKLSTSKIVQILNNYDVFGIDIELNDIDTTESLSDPKQSFLSLTDV